MSTEIKEVIDGIGRAFEEFKSTNDQRLAKIEKGQGVSDLEAKLAKAENAAERAYRGGALSYMEWAFLQSERTTARKQQLEAALEAQRALIEIQRLTGQAFVAAPASQAKQETTP